MNIYYPSQVSMPPKIGEYAYYSKNIQAFSSKLFFCVRPRWLVKIKNYPNRHFYTHFTSRTILPDYYNCICLGKCIQIIDKLNLIKLKRQLDENID